MNKVLSEYDSEAFTRPELSPPVTKPMLNGEAVYTPIVSNKSFPQFHSILYYVDKKNPLGSKPDNPDEDPQFYNWETAVINWGRINIPNFFLYNQNIPGGTSSFEDYLPRRTDITVENILPINGSFVNSPLKVSAGIKAISGLKKIELSFNRILVNSFNVSGNYYRYEYYLNMPLNPQNLIEIKVTDNLGKEVKNSIIVFH